MQQIRTKYDSRSVKTDLKIKSFEFNLRELAGSTGDFGTLFPLAIGYIYVCGLNPAGFLVMMGLTNPLQPLYQCTGLTERYPWENFHGTRGS